MTSYRYSTKAEATTELVIAPLEVNGYAQREDYDIDAIVAEVIEVIEVDDGEFFVQAIPDEEFWSVVESHKK